MIVVAFVLRHHAFRRRQKYPSISTLVSSPSARLDPVAVMTTVMVAICQSRSRLAFFNRIFTFQISAVNRSERRWDLTCLGTDRQSCMTDLPYSTYKYTHPTSLARNGASHPYVPQPHSHSHSPSPSPSSLSTLRLSLLLSDTL